MKKTLALGLTAMLGLSGGIGLMAHTYADDELLANIEEQSPVQAFHSQLSGSSTYLVSVQETWAKPGTIATVPIYLERVDTENGFNGATLTLATRLHGLNDSIVFLGFDTEDTLFDQGTSAYSDENMKINLATVTPIKDTGTLIRAKFKVASNAIPGSTLTLYVDADFTDGTSNEITSIDSQQAKITVACNDTHHFSDPIYEASTCSKEGKVISDCEVCHWPLIKTLPRRPHMLDLSQKGTDENEGKYKCKTCDEYFALSYNADDVYTILKYDVGLITLTDEQRGTFEADNKSNLDTGDAVSLLRILYPEATSGTDSNDSTDGTDGTDEPVTP